MKQATRYTGLGAAMVALLAACSQQPATTATASGAAPVAQATPPPVASTAGNDAAGADVPAFAEPAGGIVVNRVAQTHVTRDFKRSYLALDSWTLYPDPGSIGQPLVALVMDGSNAVTSAEMRIGRSGSAADIQACTRAPAEAIGAAGHAEIGGVGFTRFSVGDAAMSHYLSAQSYRAVHRGACYAIDLIIAGTRPEVYDPPRAPPFTQDQANQRLAAMLAAVRWSN
ncbi:hypothetical protein KQ945_05280 [Bacillus subtilis subsp. subtilis]|nr:hypothetical protein [Bacillus subtilis subsp. subtilis]